MKLRLSIPTLPTTPAEAAHVSVYNASAGSSRIPGAIAVSPASPVELDSEDVLGDEYLLKQLVRDVTAGKLAIHDALGTTITVQDLLGYMR